MAKKKSGSRSRRTGTTARRALAGGLARLVDIAPQQLNFFSEDSDWDLVADDLRVAMETIRSEHPETDRRRNRQEDDELVEA
jgi:hypothetical protein